MKPTTQRLGAREFMQKLNKGTIALPSIQREYVWTDQQVIGFMESIFKQRPLGNQFHLWIPNGKEYGEVSEHARSIHFSTNKVDPKLEYLIIDGQQRLTSLHRVFTGALDLLFDPITGKFYKQNQKKGNQVFPKSKTAKYISVRQLWMWPDTVEAFIDSGAKESFQRFKERDLIFNNIQKLMDELQGLAFDCTILDGHSTTDIIDIFIILNSAGQNVNTKESVVIPLLIQSIPGIRSKINNFIEEKVKSKYSEQLSSMIDVNFVAMALVYQMFGYTNNIRSYATKDAYLKHAEGQKLLDDSFTIVCKGLEEVLKLLSEELGINTSSTIESYFSIQVMALAFGNRNANSSDTHSVDATEHQAALLYFLVSNSFSRYSNMENRKYDIEIAKKSTGALVSLGRAMLKYRKELNRTWFTEESLRSVKYSPGRAPVINLLGIRLRQEGAIGLCNGLEKIDFNHSDKHHIFPESKIRSSKFKDNIGNITYINSNINRIEFKDKLPHQYLRNIGVLNTYDEVKVRTQLSKHFIDLDNINTYDDKYDEKQLIADFETFTKIRRHAIAASLNEMLNEYAELI
jgi:hypothetical protein